MNEPILFEIRCPFQRLGKTDGKLYTCNSLCAQLTAGSSGEFRCRKCRLNFWGEVDSRARPMTGVRVKQAEAEEKEQLA